ncbi:MAG: hypothetical protein QXQ40_01010 [Candidatus Aenigmatarchaeota archaeon]
MVSRYGKKIRERKLKTKPKKRYMCPVCSRKAVSRVASGIWACKKCKTKFASDSYEFKL